MFLGKTLWLRALNESHLRPFYYFVQTGCLEIYFKTYERSFILRTSSMRHMVRVKWQNSPIKNITQWHNKLSIGYWSEHWINNGVKLKCFTFSERRKKGRIVVLKHDTKTFNRDKHLYSGSFNNICLCLWYVLEMNSTFNINKQHSSNSLFEQCVWWYLSWSQYGNCSLWLM